MHKQDPQSPATDSPPGTRPALEGFLGTWRITREITDARAGATAAFAGEVRFHPGQGGLIYDETGQLLLPGQPPMVATRRYVWRADGALIALYFDDGRPFHAIGPGGRPEDSHDCPPDRYDVCYDFTAWPVWSARWRVRGPRKDYVSLTRFQRD